MRCLSLSSDYKPTNRIPGGKRLVENMLYLMAGLHICTNWAERAGERERGSGGGGKGAIEG